MDGVCINTVKVHHTAGRQRAGHRTRIQRERALVIPEHTRDRGSRSGSATAGYVRMESKCTRKGTKGSTVYRGDAPEIGGAVCKGIGRSPAGGRVTRPAAQACIREGRVGGKIDPVALRYARSQVLPDQGWIELVHLRAVIGLEQGRRFEGACSAHRPGKEVAVPRNRPQSRAVDRLDGPFVFPPRLQGTARGPGGGRVASPAAEIVREERPGTQLNPVSFRITSRIRIRPAKRWRQCIHNGPHGRAP